MGYTYAKSIHQAETMPDSQISILETYPARVLELKKEGRFTIHDQPDICVPHAEIILLAVKPQQSSELFSSMQKHILPHQLIISIMAGVKISTIQESLGTNQVVRAMPNLPAQIGFGMTAFCPSPHVDANKLNQVQSILNSTGKSIEVPSEDAIDASTGISGSGPAYVFYFMQSMMNAAEELGFSNEEAKLLVTQTFEGTVKLFRQSDLSADEWISRVASKGGTTKAALDSFKQNKLNKKIMQGAMEAYYRAIELGKSE